MGRLKRERTEIMNCTGCGEFKHISKFGKAFICKECNGKYVKASNEKKELEVLNILVVKGLFSIAYVQKYSEHILSLYRSCKSRIRSCNAKEGYYTDVANHWAKLGQTDGSLSMVIDIIENKREMFEVWRILYQNYIRSDYNKELKPEVDRILNDKKIGYTLSNIRASTHKNNLLMKNLLPSKILVTSVKTDKIIRQHLFERLIDVSTVLKNEYGITKKEFEKARNNQKSLIQVNENYNLLYIPIKEIEMYESTNNDPNITYTY